MHGCLIQVGKSLTFQKIRKELPNNHVFGGLMGFQTPSRTGATTERFFQRAFCVFFSGGQVRTWSFQLVGWWIGVSRKFLTAKINKREPLSHSILLLPKQGGCFNPWSSWSNSHGGCVFEPTRPTSIFSGSFHEVLGDHKQLSNDD